MKKNSLQISIVFLIVMITFLFSNKFNQYSTISSGIDQWEYHSVAVNFAKYNKFPLMGIYQDEKKYQFDRFERSDIEDYLFCRWSSSGSVFSFEKPPLYSLILGSFYKVFGVDIKSVYLLNLGIYILIIYLTLLICNQLFVHKIIFSFLSIFLFLIFGSFNGLSNVSPDLLLTSITLLTIFYILKHEESTSVKHLIGLGVLFAFMASIKGNVIFFILLYPFYFLLTLGFSKLFFKSIFIVYLTFIISISPWMIYANVLKLTTVKMSVNWGENLLKTEETCQLEIKDFKKVEDNRQHRINLIRNNNHHKLVSSLWSNAYVKNKFIVISNQFRPNEFLSLHNELCVNGNWKPEWRFNKNAYHNKHQVGKNPYFKIICFYMDNPKLFFKIGFAKVNLAFGTTFSIYCLSLFLVGYYLLSFNTSKMKQRILFSLTLILFFCIYSAGYLKLIILLSVLVFIFGLLTYRKKHIRFIPFSLVLLLLNSFLIIVIIYGGERFVYFIDPISIITSLLILENVFLKNINKVKNEKNHE